MSLDVPAMSRCHVSRKMLTLACCSFSLWFGRRHTWKKYSLSFIFVCVCVCVCLWVHVCVGTHCARGGHYKASKPLGLELQVVVSYPSWVLGSKCPLTDQQAPLSTDLCLCSCMLASVHHRHCVLTVNLIKQEIGTHVALFSWVS